MYINSIGWWLILVLAFSAYFIFRFGMISHGRGKFLIAKTGFILLIGSFVLMTVFFGLISGIVLIAIFWLIIRLIVELLIGQINKKMYSQYSQVDEQLAKQLGITVNELRKLNDESQQFSNKEDTYNMLKSLGVKKHLMSNKSKE